jgi:hypothetical protein
VQATFAGAASRTIGNIVTQAVNGRQPIPKEVAGPERWKTGDTDCDQACLAVQIILAVVKVRLTPIEAKPFSLDLGPDITEPQLLSQAQGQWWLGLAV